MFLPLNSRYIPLHDRHVEENHNFDTPEAQDESSNNEISTNPEIVGSVDQLL
jgi:hypothetical protein